MKKNVNFKFLLCAVALCYGNAYAQTSSGSVEEPMETGIYEANWESLSQYEVPEWFRDAKFGIWAHWGPQCEPESGDWYARHMYFPGHWQYNAHVNKYGNPAEFGFKDVINIWKAASWDPEYLISFYKSVGARYFMALANHHDNFDLWDSKYQPWNSVNMGPKQDIVGKWAEQCKKYGLPLGVSIHASHAWTWMEGSQDFDGKLTKEDGVGKWWEGYDPQDLYAQNHPRSENSHDVGAIHSQWEWGNGAAEMTEEYKTKFYNRTLDVINKYNPDMVYFDDSTLPFYPVSDEGLKIAAHMYNKSLKDHDNQMRAVIMGKKLTEEQQDAMIWDVERGIPDRCQEKAWQTCTCLGQWHYDRGVYDRNEYKSAATVVKMLIDIVSKNGNLLLSVPVRGNGTIDEKEVAILNGIKGWMDVNHESIYGTRPWTIFGEGPTAEASNPINNQGFNEGTNYTSDDIRFVERHDTVYVTAMGWPETNQMVVKSLASTSPYYNNKIKEVKLLGYEGDVEYTCDKTALTVDLPAEMSSTIAPVLMVRFTDEVNYADLESLRQEVAGKLDEVAAYVGNNSGQYAEAYVNLLRASYEEAMTVDENAQSDVISETYVNLRQTYGDFALNAQIKGGLAQNEELTQNVTVKYLEEVRHFSRSDEGVLATSRFGILDDPWVVTPNIMNQENFTRGGFDGYVAWNDFTGKAIGIQKWEASLPGIENGKIYQTVTLPAGKYSLKMAVHEQVNYKKGELYAVVANGEEMLNTSEVEDKALAYYDMSVTKTGQTYDCCEFTLDKETEVSIGWTVTIGADATERSMRVSALHLYKDGVNVSADYLGNYENIKRKDKSYKRFGVPAYWSTRNFEIPQNNTDGTKQGIDKYPGYNTLMMGIWKDTNKAVGDLGNATLYRQVTLPAGKYFFGASYEALYQIQEGYLFASKELPAINEMGKCLAYSSAKHSATGSDCYGITFTLDEETTLYLGWINNFTEGSETQEFRVKDVTLLRYLDGEGMWEDDEALKLNDGKLDMTPREWAKILNGTYNQDGNNDPYLPATPDMEIQLGQIDLTDVNEITVRMICSEDLGEDAEYRFYLDNETTPWVVMKPEKTESTLATEIVKAECPETAGVHAVRMVLFGHQSSVYAISFKDSENAGGGEDAIQEVNGTDADSEFVNVYNLNGIMLKHQVKVSEALNDLPKGIYLLNGKKIIK